MKLFRHGRPGLEKPGLIDAAQILRDASQVVPDYTPAFFAQDGLAALRRLDASSLPELPADTRLGPPIATPGKVVCVGLNYRDHAEEMGQPLPTQPLIFMKAATAITGPHDVVELPPGSTCTDWEVELGVVIGRTAKRLENTQQALACVAGYVMCNDISEREHQLEHMGQWTKGKSADTFLPLGPWLVSADAVVDPQDLSLELDVNDQARQRGHTSTMVFGVLECLRSISQYMTLQPGDVVSTGTPPGVGMGQTPPVYLKAGDTMRVGITGLGEQRLTVVQA